MHRVQAIMGSKHHYTLVPIHCPALWAGIFKLPRLPENTVFRSPMPGNSPAHNPPRPEIRCQFRRALRGAVAAPLSSWLVTSPTAMTSGRTVRRTWPPSGWLAAPTLRSPRIGHGGSGPADPQNIALAGRILDASHPSHGAAEPEKIAHRKRHPTKCWRNRRMQPFGGGTLRVRPGARRKGVSAHSYQDRRWQDSPGDGGGSISPGVRMSLQTLWPSPCSWSPVVRIPPVTLAAVPTTHDHAGSHLGVVIAVNIFCCNRTGMGGAGFGV